MIDTVTETTELPVERVTKLRPSEAMRLGRLIAPRWIPFSMNDGRGGACAWGAMTLGNGGNFPALPDLPQPCICDLGVKKNALVVVTHLNDSHNGRHPIDRDPWPTERIASWLESLGL